MRQHFLTAFVALLANIALSFSALPADAQKLPSYRLNAGDVLMISVWKEEDLQREVVILPDGTVSFPLAGHVNAAGLTPDELQKTLSQRIEQYIPDAADLVSVSVLQVNGNKVFVIGLVNKPGEFQIMQPMTVLQALSLAGGLTQFASEESIKIIRREAGKETAIPFDYSVVKQGRDLESNIELKSGDVVVVSGKSLF
jgi:polysaccharide biosynthesis/export protein